MRIIFYIWTSIVLTSTNIIYGLGQYLNPSIHTLITSYIKNNYDLSHKLIECDKHGINSYFIANVCLYYFSNCFRIHLLFHLLIKFIDSVPGMFDDLPHNQYLKCPEYVTLGGLGNIMWQRLQAFQKNILHTLVWMFFFIIIYMLR